MTPRGGKWLVIFCDEINLPSEDKYGTQRVISFMRHVVELVRALCASVCAYVLCVCSCACVRVFEGATWDRSCVLATDLIMYLLFHGLSPFLFTCTPVVHRVIFVLSRIVYLCRAASGAARAAPRCGTVWTACSLWVPATRPLTPAVYPSHTGS